MIMKTNKKITELSLAYTDANLDILKYYPNLESLNLAKTKIKTLKGIEYCTKLKNLIISGATELVNFDGIELLSNLEFLEISFTNIKDLTPISKCKNLKKLFAYSCGITNYDCLENTNLIELDMSNNHSIGWSLSGDNKDVITLDRIPKLPKSLVALNISNCGFTSLNGLEHLKDLKYLNANSYEYSLKNVDAIKDLLNLKEVNLNNGGFESVELNTTHLNCLLLANCENLKSVKLANNKYVEKIDITQTEVDNFSFLENIEKLKFLKLHWSKQNLVQHLQDKIKIVY